MVVVCAVDSAEINQPDKAKAMMKRWLEKKVRGRIAVNGECVSDMEVLCIEMVRQACKPIRGAHPDSILLDLINWHDSH